MEDMTVVFFTVDQKMIGHRKNKESWKYRVRRGTEQQNRPEQQNQVRLRWWDVVLPACEKKNLQWTEMGLVEYLQGLDIPVEGRRVYYMPDRAAGQMLGRVPEPLTLEWILFLTEYYVPEFDGLVVLQDREMQAEELILRYAPCKKYLGVVTWDVEKWEEMADMLEEEYGFLLDVAKSFEELHIKGNHTLVISGERMYDGPEHICGIQGTWLHTLVDRTGCREVSERCRKARKVQYVDFYRFLTEMNITKAVFCQRKQENREQGRTQEEYMPAKRERLWKKLLSGRKRDFA